MKTTMILLALPMLAAAQTTQHVKVLEYCPAPGQFVGMLPAIDATAIDLRFKGLHGVLYVSTLLKFIWLKPVLVIVTGF